MVTINVTVHFVQFLVNLAYHVIHNIVMPVCVPNLVKCYLATIHCVHCGIMIFTNQTLVRHRLVPERQVVQSLKCVNCEVEKKFSSAQFKVPYEGFPYGILLLLLSKF